MGVKIADRVFECADINGFKKVKLKYSGGEPTMNMSAVRAIHSRARELADSYGVWCDEVMLSNGTTLNLEDADWIAGNGIDTMISIDGIGTVNDTLRPYTSGRGAFSRIEKVVDTVLLPRGIRPTISITITPHNAHGVADITEWCLQRDLPFSFNLCRVSSLSGASRGLTTVAEGKIIQGIQEAYEVIETRAPTRPFLDGLLDRVSFIAHRSTCGIGMNYVVVDQEGAVAQCQMRLDLSVGRVTDHSDLLSLVKRSPYSIHSKEISEECKKCRWRYQCAGGCPVESYNNIDRPNKSPYCTVYKKLIPKALRLEGLRLLGSMDSLGRNLSTADPCAHTMDDML
jgi:uncharacterized protein